MNETSRGEGQSQIDEIRSGIREIAHDISSPLGVLRMAAYYLQTVQPEKEKRDYYLKLINETIDKMEIGLQKLRSLADTAPPGDQESSTGGTT